ncbi:MAG: hypothetical protein LBV26_02100, partial [Bacteroidales bacterium]|nr:hypothetical protein [Bacteroidales bacterium]
MKKVLFLALVGSVLLAGCNKDDDSSIPTPSGTDQMKEIFEGVFINNSPSVQPTILNVYPEGNSASESDFGFSSGNSKTVLPNDDGKRGYDYRFKLVGEHPTIKLKNLKGDLVDAQASHVKITDDAKYAFVSYNTKYDDHIGGIIIFNVSDVEHPFVTAELHLNNAELSAVDYDAETSVLYATGATVRPAYGYLGDANTAFVMSVALDRATMKFLEDSFFDTMLTSYQGTSVKVANGYVYVTTGDGANSTKGGLYILNKGLTEAVNFIEADNARSIDVDETEGSIYVMQAEHARITKYDATGNNPQKVYEAVGEAKQHHAKSEIALWNGYVFAAENESGMRMINAGNSSVAGQLIWPEGSDLENHVTNSVAINSDRKSYLTENTYFESNLLLLANGGKGLYWYDIVDGKIVMCNTNSIDFGEKYSANFVASRGNVVFVADGFGGLKILTITVDNGKPDIVPEPETACTDAYENFFNPKNTASLFPEGRSVFANNATVPVKTLFAGENAGKVMKSIKVTNKTNLYISYMHEGAGFKNSLAFYVVPSGQDNTFEYFQNNINKEGKFYTTQRSQGKIINDKHLILPNISDAKEGGPLKQGQMFQIKNYETADGSFNAGDEVVLVLIQDGWRAQNSNVWMPSTNSTWQLPAFMNYDVLRGLLS